MASLSCVEPTLSSVCWKVYRPVCVVCVSLCMVLIALCVCVRRGGGGVLEERSR